MTRPTDVAGVYRLVGLTRYLRKFLPRLSDMTKPLRDMTQKEADFLWDEPLNTAPRRLQCMMLALQKYDLNVDYKRGETMFLADTLRQAYLSEVNSCEVSQQYESVDHRSSIPVTDERWQQLQFASANDPVLQQLRNVIQHRWPNDRSGVPECMRPFFDSREELLIQDSLVFKGHLLVVPAAVRSAA